MSVIGGQKPAGGQLPEDRQPAPCEPDPLERSVEKYIRKANADNSLLAYRKQWQAFVDWCTTKGLCQLPATPDTLALYLSSCADAGLSVATLAQAKSAITREHESAGHTSPAAPRVKSTWEGIRRQLGVAPKQKQPLEARELRAMYAELPTGILGLRDRALIGLGFAGGFRRSELVALDVCDLTFVAGGLEAIVRRSKTDQQGKGLTKNMAFANDPSMCSVHAVRDWLELAGIGDGPVFRPINRHGHVSGRRLSADAVAVLLKRAAKAAGIPGARCVWSLAAGGLRHRVEEARRRRRCDHGSDRPQEPCDAPALSPTRKEVGEAGERAARSVASVGECNGAVSDNGRTLVGNGLNAEGHPEGSRVVLPQSL